MAAAPTAAEMCPSAPEITLSVTFIQPVPSSEIQSKFTSHSATTTSLGKIGHCAKHVKRTAAFTHSEPAES